MEILNIGLLNVNKIIAVLTHARRHTSAATTAALEGIGFEVVPHPSYSSDLAPSDFWILQLSKNTSSEFTSHVVQKFKLLRKNALKNNLKISPATFSENLFIAGEVVSDKRKTRPKNKA